MSPCSVMAFQSTRPVRGATAGGSVCGCVGSISIHAPRAGRDFSVMASGLREYYFNPRAPCGARQVTWKGLMTATEFQSTRPVRGATARVHKFFCALLRQKAILRQFHAKRRLLKHFSTYKYRNTFLICSANRMGKICTLPLRTTRSLDLPEGMSACSQSARFCFRTFFPSSKTADYPAPDP